MGAWDYDDLKRHLGHKIVCISYVNGPNDQSPENVAIECKTCNEVLLDFDKYDYGTVEVNDSVFITDLQRTAIESMAKMKGYDVVENLNTMSYTAAAMLIRRLNRMGQGSEEIL